MPVRARSSLKERVAQLTADNLELESRLNSGDRGKRRAAVVLDDDSDDSTYRGHGAPRMSSPPRHGQRRRRAPSEDEDERLPPPVPSSGFATGLGKSRKSIAALAP